MTAIDGQHAAPGTEARNTWQHERAMVIAGLRAAADFLEHHPDVPTPEHTTLTTYIWGDQSRSRLAAIARALGRCDKRSEHGFFRVSRSFGPIALSYDATSEQVCDRIEVGTETLEETVEVCPRCESELTVDEQSGWTVCSDEDCPYEVMPAKQITRTVERPRFETRCPESLLSPREQWRQDMADLGVASDDAKAVQS